MLLWAVVATSSADWCLEANLSCQEGFCSCARRLASSESASASSGNPIVEIRNTQTAVGSTECPSCPWWLIPLAFLVGLLLGTCLLWMCFIPGRVRSRGKQGANGGMNFSDKKSLHAEFTEEQFHELCKNVDLKRLVMTDDVECFTCQGPMKEIMYGTICRGWQLWQLHSSVDDDDPDQDEDAVREMLRCTDGLTFPMTGYFFVETDEFEEAARRAQELEHAQTAPLLAPGGAPPFQSSVQYQPVNSYQGRSGSYQQGQQYGSGYQYSPY